jgi:hypothetical protein
MTSSAGSSISLKNPRSPPQGRLRVAETPKLTAEFGRHEHTAQIVSQTADATHCYHTTTPSRQAAACLWLKNNPKKWEHLVRFPERLKSPFFCPAGSTDGLCDSEYVAGWVLFFVQLLLGLFAIAFSHYLQQPHHDISDAEVRSRVDKAIAAARPQLADDSHRQRQHVDLVTRFLTNENGKQRLAVLDDIHAVPRALTYKRTYDNFIKASTDADIIFPPKFGDERWIADLKRGSLYPYLFFSAGRTGLRSTLMMSVAFGLLSGSLASLFFLLVKWDTYKYDPTAFANNRPSTMEGNFMTTVIQETGSKFQTMIGTFAFLPAFLMLGYLGYTVGRWRHIFELTLLIQGGVVIPSQVISGAILDHHKEESRQLAWRVYRYLNVAHILCYKNMHQYLKPFVSRISCLWAC